jgi:ribosomal protein L37E
MSADFYATEKRKCAECGYGIEVGTVVRWSEDGKLVHSVCPS